MLISCCRFGITVQGRLMIRKLFANNTLVHFMLAFNFLLQKVVKICVCTLTAVESFVCGISGTCRVLKTILYICIYVQHTYFLKNILPVALFKITSRALIFSKDNGLSLTVLLPCNV